MISTRSFFTRILAALAVLISVCYASPASAQYSPAGQPAGGGLSPTSVTGSGLWTSTSGALNSAASLGTAGQGLFTNSGATGVSWGGSGDISFSTSTPGQLNITNIAGLAGGTVTLGDGTHNLLLTSLGSLQATPPTLVLTAAAGFGATSANANPGGAVSLTAGAGGASVTSGTGGAGAIASLVGGAGGASAGGSANSNGGNSIWGSGAAGTGGGGAAGVAGTLLAQVGGTTVEQFNQASTDFTAYGAGTVAATGFVRFPNNAGSLMVARHNGASDDVVISQGAADGSITFGNVTGASTQTVNVESNGLVYLRGSAITSGNGFVEVLAQYGEVAVQSTLGSQGDPGIQFSDNFTTNYALGIMPAYSGTTSLIVGPAVTAFNFLQKAQASTSGGSGATGTTWTVSCGQNGQAATGTSNNGGNGGACNLSSGVGGTSGSATAGNPGPLNLQVGTVTVDSAQCGTPLAGIGHAGGVNALCTVAQATSASVTTYVVNTLCKATTLYTGGAVTDTFRDEEEYTVRNVGGTLTQVASVTVAKSTQSDSSMSTNTPTMSLSGTNVTFNITPPTLAAGAETCSAVSRVKQTL